MLFCAAGVLEARDASEPTKVFDPAGLGLIRTIAPGGDPYGVAFTLDGRRLAQWNWTVWSGLGFNSGWSVSAIALRGCDLYAAGCDPNAPQGGVSRWD